MKRYRFDGSDEYGPYEDAGGRYVIHDDCAAELAKLREQRDRLALAWHEEISCDENGIVHCGYEAMADEALEQYGLRIIDGKVEEIGNG